MRGLEIVLPKIGHKRKKMCPQDSRLFGRFYSSYSATSQESYVSGAFAICLAEQGDVQPDSHQLHAPAPLPIGTPQKNNFRETWSNVC